jgi:hypothetical protein
MAAAMAAAMVAAAAAPSSLLYRWWLWLSLQGRAGRQLLATQQLVLFLLLLGLLLGVVLPMALLLVVVVQYGVAAIPLPFRHKLLLRTALSGQEGLCWLQLFQPHQGPTKDFLPTAAAAVY